MKWAELYNGLELLPPVQQPDIDCDDYFTRMRDRGQFYFSPFHVKVTDPDSDDLYFKPDDQDLPVRVNVLQALVADEDHLQLTCKLIGILPPGFRHGTFDLVFDLNWHCTALPPDMFEDEYVPQEEFTHWKCITGCHIFPYK